MHGMIKNKVQLYKANRAMEYGKLNSSTTLLCSAREDPTSDLRVPVIVDSRSNAAAPRTFKISTVFSWPCRAAAAVGGAIIIVFKLLFLVLALMLYALLLMPGFLRMIVYYFFSDNVVRGIMYGSKPRQRLDLYFPVDARHDSIHPVIIYITGGAWTIGYKAWGALLARRLCEQGVLVACLDYRNFPQGDALDMLEDVNTGISWVLARIHRFGGDPDNVTLVGQSAGGHLAGLALIKQAQQAATRSAALGACPAWSPSRLRAFVGVSGAFDLVALAEHRGGHFRRLLDKILALEEGVEEDAIGHESGDAAKEGEHGGKDRTGGLTGRGDEGQSSGVAIEESQPVWVNDNGSVEDGRHDAAVAERQQRDDTVAEGAATAEDAEGVRGEGRPGIGNRSSSSSRLHWGRWWRRPLPAPAPAPPRPARRKRPAYDALSPLQAAQRLPPGAAAMLPYVLLIHGTADKTVPAQGSVRLSEALQSAGAPRCRYVLVPGKTHTAFLLEDPMRGGRDLLTDEILGAVSVFREEDVEEGRGQAVTGDRGSGRLHRSLCPGFLCDLAARVCPF
ncbi:hypothetical protein Vretimale_10228 [Volvox reticuliferus]|uniref:protein-S-isoprenylcysteine alpha-carbonyl methylesterase n=1 Tax=Volvox reticuliferus TaxID=1737510 RepID=A0A8J4GFC1_9CHLO|nr:hypothetical protein Vretimale_10228 [Volvox reticuliferus]